MFRGAGELIKHFDIIFQSMVQTYKKGIKMIQFLMNYKVNDYKTWYSVSIFFCIVKSHQYPGIKKKSKLQLLLKIVILVNFWN